MLEVRRESFVEPEVVPGCVGDEVAGPGMRELVHDHRHEAPVTRNDRWRDEREARVFHAAESEGAWHDEEVVAVPAIRSGHFLAGLEHARQVLELPGRSLEP